MAYNGQNCDMKWLWKLTQALRSPFSLPSKLKWLMDPYKVITSHPDCPFNHHQTKLDSYNLGVLWSYIHNDMVHIAEWVTENKMVMITTDVKKSHCNNS